MTESNKKTYGKSEKEIKAYEKALESGKNKALAKAEAFKNQSTKTPTNK